MTALLLTALAALALETWARRTVSLPGAVAAAFIALAAALPAVAHGAWFLAALSYGTLLLVSGVREGEAVAKATAAALRAVALAMLAGLLAPNLAFSLAMPVDLAAVALTAAAAAISVLAAVLAGGPRLAPFAAVGSAALPFHALPIVSASVAAAWILTALAIGFRPKLGEKPRASPLRSDLMR